MADNPNTRIRPLSPIERSMQRNNLGPAPARNVGGPTQYEREPDLSTLSPIQRSMARNGIQAAPAEPTGLARFVSDLPPGVRNTVGGALRGLASSLEPIQLPQDAMFSVIAGAFDEDTTIAERLRGMEWGKYAPYGEAPARPASGEEIFTLMGMGEDSAKWAGIAADLTVDPLVFGSFVRIAGRLGGLDDLVRLGDKMDDMISPLGIGRDVTKAARRSPALSNFMDRRTEDFMQVFRDPDSSVLGIRHFGKKATGLLEQILPQERVDRLRFGPVVAEELASARRGGEGATQRLTSEAAEALHRATRGFNDEEVRHVTRAFMEGMEAQKRAYFDRLAGLDPTVRDVIERNVYEVVRPAKGKGEAGVGLLPYLRGEEGITRAFDPETTILSTLDEGVEGLTRELYGATRSAVEGSVDASRQFDPEDVFRVTSDRIQERLNGIREQVGALARERGERAGMGLDDLQLQESQAIRAFDGYLGDTLQIDAKLGMATSGYDFIGRTVRNRSFEIAGDLEVSNNLWQRVLQRGLFRGKEGIKQLRDESTGLSLSEGFLYRSAGDVETSVRRRQAYQDLVRQRLEDVRGGTGPERVRRLDAYAAQVEDIAERAGSMLTDLKTNYRSVDGLASSETFETIRQGEKMLNEYRQTAADLIAASGSGAPEFARFMQAEDRLARVMDSHAQVIARATENARTASAGGVAASMVPDRAFDWMNDMRNEASDLASQMRTASGGRAARRATADRAAAARVSEDAPAIREEAMQAVRDRYPEQPPGTPPHTLDIEDAIIPLQGRHAIKEDILATRLRSGQYDTIADAAKEPITFGELFDGAADMQALPIGEFLEGLMTGHLRRVYAIFGDSNDFQAYIDSLRAGTVVPSNVIDETRLVQHMEGYEREAELITNYHALLTSHGRGTILKRTGIAEYLLNSGVAPERVNGAMRSMMQAIRPGEKGLDDFLRKMESMVPDYRAILAKRDRALDTIGEVTQPRVTNTRFFNPQEEVPQHMLEQMGEIAMARASLGDSIAIARRVTSKQEMFQGVYEVGKARGLIKGHKFTDEFGVRFKKLADGETVMGGFSGKYVHPYLWDELRKASSVDTKRIPHAFTRIRALITGGYLAAPSVIAANFFGGLYQGATAGINPATMLRRMIEVAPDVERASRGYKGGLVHELGRHMNLDVSSLRYQDFTKDLKQIRLDDFGLGPQGVNKVFDDVATAYERFLQRPGIGRFRTRFAGLEGFQYTENWFKVATYREMKERLTRMAADAGENVSDGAVAMRIQKQAAESARTVVFDYSELPKGLDTLKNYGLVLFPGFPYFLAGRTVDALMRRPGTLAVADRMSEALANATLGLEDQMSLLMGMPEWLQGDQGVPMPFTMRSGPSGESIVSALPLNQLLPTSTIWDGPYGAGNPWAESVASLGIMGPFFEVISALVSGSGEAPFTARYGNRVFDADSQGPQKMFDITRFLYNTLAPSNVKKLITVDMENRLKGLLPAAPEFFKSMSQPFGEEALQEAYKFDEIRSGRPERTWREDVISTFLRSPQVVALEGPISGVRRELRNQQANLGSELTMLRRRANRARSNGDEREFNRHVAEIERRSSEFNEKWESFMRFYRAYEQAAHQRGMR